MTPKMTKSTAFFVAVCLLAQILCGIYLILSKLLPTLQQ